MRIEEAIKQVHTVALYDALEAARIAAVYQRMYPNFAQRVAMPNVVDEYDDVRVRDERRWW